MPGLSPLAAVAVVTGFFFLAVSFFWLPNPYNIISIVGGLVLFVLFASGYGIPRR